MKTLNDFYVLYKRDLKTSVKENSFIAITHLVESSFEKIPFLLKKDIVDITREDIIFSKEILSKCYSSMIVYRTLIVIRNLLDIAVSEKAVINNVARYIKLPKVRYKTPKTISTQDFGRVIEKIKEIRTKQNDINEIILFLKLLFKTGLRQAEARALKWENINFWDNTLTVRHSIFCNYYNNNYILQEPKTKASYRTIHLDKKLIEELKRYRYSRENNKNEDFIFCKSNGHPRIAGFAKFHLKKACRELDINAVSTHGLRHSHASFLLKNKVDIFSISKRLGHSNVFVTLKFYCHLMENDEEDIINLIQNI